MKIAITIIIALLSASFAAGHTTASDQTAVKVAIHQFLDGFNNGDIKSALAACAEETVIIDEFPPYEWHGAGACSKWASDYDADTKKNGITDPLVVLSNPRHMDVTGDVAYVVVPANYTYKKNGKPMKETNSIFTAVLHRETAGWHIIAWSWAKN